MTATLLTTGLACVIAAIVGGGLNAFGIKVPIIKSFKRQVMLAGFGVCLLGAAFFTGPWDVGSTEDVACEEEPRLVLNEICAEGNECDGEADFVEVYNPSKSPINLSCYTLADLEHRKPLSGELAAGEIRGWTEGELGFGLAWEEDKVFLRHTPPGGSKRGVDSRPIDRSQTYQQRVPDGEGWEHLDHEAVESQGHVGSLHSKNRQDR